MTNTLTGKQASLFCSVLLFATKLLLLPSLLYSSSGTSGIFSVIIIFIFEYIFLYFLIKIKKNNNKINFYSIIKNKLGKIITKIIFFVLFLFFIFKTIYILQECFTFLKYALYTEASIFVYLICVLPVITALAYKGLKAFGRTLEIFYALILVLILFCTFAWMLNVETFSFLTLNQLNVGKIAETIFSHTFWFGDFVFLLLIIDKVNLENGNTRNFMTYSLISMLVIVLFFVVYFITFQTTSFLHTHAIYDIVQFGGDFGTIGKFDAVAVFAIMFIMYFQLAMFLFCAELCITKIVPFKHKAQTHITLNLLLIASSYIFFNNANNLAIFFGKYLNWLCIFVAYFVPILFLILARKNIFSKNNKKNIWKYNKKIIKNITFNQKIILNKNIFSKQKVGEK